MENTLSKSDVVSILQIIDANYPNSLNLKSIDLLANSWCESLQEYDKNKILIAFKLVLKESTYPIKLAHIINKLRELNVLDNSLPILWDKLCETIAIAKNITFTYAYINGYPDAKKMMSEVYADLSNELKEFVTSTRALEELAKQDNLTYEKNRFFNEMPELLKKHQLKKDVSKVLQLENNGTNKNR